nr:hypothetical protein [Nocardia wallacei]
MTVAQDAMRGRRFGMRPHVGDQRFQPLCSLVPWGFADSQLVGDGSLEGGSISGFVIARNDGEPTRLQGFDERPSAFRHRVDLRGR